MMRFDAGRLVEGKTFDIVGASYIGAPRPNTAMFITRKVERLLPALETVCDCLVFAETGMEVPERLLEKHGFVFSDKPQLAYARFADRFAAERAAEERTRRYIQTPGGYCVFEGTQIPEDAYIEPGCVIGPDVQLGKRARILANCVVRRATIGDDFLANEHAAIGTNGFTMAVDENGDKIRIPTLGRVRIGDHVEVGSHDNISCGSGGDTVLEDRVKLDALVHIGHDVHIHENVEITAGTTLGGFVDIGDESFIGLGSVFRNRIEVGKQANISMGSVVIRSIPDGARVFGNPAKKLIAPR